MMKKFITYIAQQPKGFLKKYKYTAENNKKLEYDEEISFPITAVINGYTEEEEEIEIITLSEEDNENCENNLQVLKEEIEKLNQKKRLKYKFKEIYVSQNEKDTEHLKAFKKIYESVGENDELYGCLTYGTKPSPIVELMALIASDAGKKAWVGCMVYGKVFRDRNGNSSKAVMNEVTSLFFMLRAIITWSKYPKGDLYKVIESALEEDLDNGLL